MINAKLKDTAVTGQEKKIPRSTLITIIAIAIVAFIGILSETALNIAYSLLMDELKVSAAVIQWLTTGYLLTLSILLPLSPLFVRHFPTKSLFQTGIGIFTAGTLLCSFALQFEMLLLGRIIQAVGTSIALPLMMNIILEQIPISERGRIMGVVGLVISFAPALGPTFGGIIIEWINWHWIFITMLPILALSFALGSNYITDIHSDEEISLDCLSILLSTIAFVGIVYGVSLAAEKNWSDSAVISYILMGALSLALFAYRQLQLEKPLIQVRVFANSMFTIGACIVMISMMSVLAAGFVLPLYIQKSLGYSSVAAALAMLPGAAINGIMSPITGRFYDRHGPKLLLSTGFFLLVFTLFIFSFQHVSFTQLTIFYTLFMFGASMLAMPAQTNSLNQLPRQYNADGAAIMATLQQVSGAIGTALASSLLTINSGEYLEAFPALTGNLLAQSVAFGVQQNFIVFLYLAIIGFILALFTRGRRLCV